MASYMLIEFVMVAGCWSRYVEMLVEHVKVCAEWL
jgi:hypothetical protein